MSKNGQHYSGKFKVYGFNSRSPAMPRGVRDYQLPNLKTKYS